jgi:hypothetical protein
VVQKYQNSSPVTALIMANGKDRLVGKEEAFYRVKAGLEWLLKSIDATGGKGSSHIYSRWRYPLTGWHLGYPETTGYIIETLLDHEQMFPDLPLKEYALDCGEWLMTQQLDDGRFPALLAGNKQASTFNSGMIVFGLLRVNKLVSSDRINYALDKLRKRIHELYSSEQESMYPAYFSRAYWAFYLLAAHFQDIDLEKIIFRQTQKIIQSCRLDGTIPGWGFEHADYAFTHTIAYTLRGLLELAVLMGSEEMLNPVMDSCRQLALIHSQKGKLAGAYGPCWKGDYTYRCVTGNAQLSLVAYRLYEVTGDKQWFDAGKSWLDEVVDDQVIKHVDKSLIGAVPGSHPFWGPYMRLKYPNWAVKFYVDALSRYNLSDVS